MKETISNNESTADLLELSKHRQLFLLNPFTKNILPRQNITHWEQLTCAGYNPYHQRLEAIVSVKQPTGYSGTLCTPASLEYVRFFIDFHDGAGFRDMGYTNFKVADIPDTPPGPQHPLSYAAFLIIDDTSHRRFLNCDNAVIPVVRAVLSWNSIPSSDPFHPPFYGNHIDADIQLARISKVFLRNIVDVSKIQAFEKLVDTNIQVTLKEPVTENADVIYKINQAAEVAVHRTFYSTIGSKLNSAINFSKANAIFNITSLENYNIDLNSFYEFFNGAGKKADTTFEEITCVGFNTPSDRLTAVIHIKKPTGFNGNLCTRGSTEHVAFWADWNNNGTFDQHLGVVTLNVHDISNIPRGGLYYTVQLPIDVTERLRKCNNPNIVRIRAVLSWESLPSSTNPTLLNHWGNYKDALIQLRPSLGPGSGIYSAIYSVGGVDRNSINPITHLHNAGPSDSSAHNRPWGGGVNFYGVIDRNGFAGVVKYRFLVKSSTDPDVSLSWMPVSTSETFYLDDTSTAAPEIAETQTDPNGWYEYKQDPANHLFYTTNYRATWNASGRDDGDYNIRFVHTNESGIEVTADEFTIKICNRGMSVSFTANSSVDEASDLDLVIDGGDCHSYTAGTPVINGHVRALHPYFASWSLELQPTSHVHGAHPTPETSPASSIPTNGDENAVWQLNTSPLDPCGYTVSLRASSRVILNSNPGYYPTYGPKAVGFAKLP